MSRLYRVESAGAIAGIPDMGAIASLIVDNTTGGAVSVTLVDGEGGVDFVIDIPSNGEEQYRFQGLEYRGGLTAGGGVAANAVLFVELE